MSGGGPLKLGSVTMVGVLRSYLEGKLNEIEKIFIALYMTAYSNTR